MSINRQTALIVGQEIEEALQEIAGRYELEVLWKGVTFSADMIRPKAELQTTGKKANEFSTFAGRYGLVADDLGRTFEYKGTSYKITGISTRSPKRPILCEQVSSGKSFKFMASTVAGKTRT